MTNSEDKQSQEQPRTTSQVRMVSIDEDMAGQRIDNFLMREIKGVPRSLIYRLVRTGQVRINGKRCKPLQKLAAGDQVRVPPVRDKKKDEAEPGRAPRHGVPSDAQLKMIEACVIEEDDCFVAIDKPTGLASHGGSGVSFGAIELMRAARPHQTLELVHRLDRDTSGVLLLAKKRSALREVQKEIREGRVEKRYLALMSGRISQRPFNIEVPLDVNKQSQGMVRVSERGKYALSRVRWVDWVGGHSLAEITIETGRTHQIRVHAKHVEHPLLGDDKYGDFALNRQVKPLGLKRTFLHAAYLAFAMNDGGREYHISAPMPEDLQNVIERLKAIPVKNQRQRRAEKYAIRKHAPRKTSRGRRSPKK